MIEEAAGTRMFETKKMAARKTMEKKEHKLTEITTYGRHGPAQPRVLLGG